MIIKSPEIFTFICSLIYFLIFLCVFYIETISKILPIPTQQNEDQNPTKIPICLLPPPPHHFTVSLFLPEELGRKRVPKALCWSLTPGKYLYFSFSQVKIFATNNWRFRSYYNISGF